MSPNFVRKVARFLLFAVFLIILSAEVLSLLRFGILFVLHGPRGVLGEMVHIAYQGHLFPKSSEESARIFWQSTGAIFVAHLIGLVVVLGVWKIQRRLRR